MRNRWKTISIISWIALAIVLALGIIFTVSGKRANAALKAEVEEYKRLAVSGGEADPNGSGKDDGEAGSQNGSSKDASKDGKEANAGKDNKDTNGQNGAAANVVYVEKEVPKYIYIAVEPEKSDSAEPSTDPTPDQTPDEDGSQDPDDGSPDDEMPDESNKGNLAFADGVTYQMCSADYWKAKIADADAVLKDSEEIAAFNKIIVNTEGTNMYDLEAIAETCNGNKIKESLAREAVPEEAIYVNNSEKPLDKDSGEKAAYFENISDNILAAKTTDNDSVKYAIVTRRADMKSWPTPDYIGYSHDDTDEELTLSSMNINTPFVVKLITGDGKYAWGYSNICTGWVSTDDIAFCESKKEWLDAWKMTDDQFLVVTTDRLMLEPSYLTPETSALKLQIGTKLKMVPKEAVPDEVGERGSINNYVVYVPTRDTEDGSYVKSMALISQNNDMGVHVGYVPLTAGNLLELAFNCLGDRYGWGGMLESMDCSLFTRTIYSCCGVELPRNTNWQTFTPSGNYKFSDTAEDDEDKMEALDELLPGALLKFNGHIVLYLGKDNGEYYVISAVGSYFNQSGDRKNIQSISINPLSVKRGSGKTWLTCMTDFVLPWNY